MSPPQRNNSYVTHYPCNNRGTSLLSWSNITVLHPTRCKLYIADTWKRPIHVRWLAVFEVPPSGYRPLVDLRIWLSTQMEDPLPLDTSRNTRTIDLGNISVASDSRCRWGLGRGLEWGGGWGAVDIWANSFWGPYRKKSQVVITSDLNFAPPYCRECRYVCTCVGPPQV